MQAAPSLRRATWLHLCALLLVALLGCASLARADAPPTSSFEVTSEGDEAPAAPSDGQGPDANSSDCGAVGDTCCGFQCAGDDLVCNDGTCAACGTIGALCCDGLDSCLGDGLRCFNGVCACGADECCIRDNQCPEGLVCVGSVCTTRNSAAPAPAPELSPAPGFAFGTRSGAANGEAKDAGDAEGTFICDEDPAAVEGEAAVLGYECDSEAAFRTITLGALPAQSGGQTCRLAPEVGRGELTTGTGIVLANIPKDAECGKVTAICGTGKDAKPQACLFFRDQVRAGVAWTPCQAAWACMRVLAPVLSKQLDSCSQRRRFHGLILAGDVRLLRRWLHSRQHHCNVGCADFACGRGCGVFVLPTPCQGWSSRKT